MGLTVLDAGVIIGYADATDAHHLGATAAIRQALDRHDRLVLPASGYAEALVRPCAVGTDAVGRFNAMVVELPIDVAPLDRKTAAMAARIRAFHRSVRLADALVIATAISLEANSLITTDARWPASPDVYQGVKLVVLAVEGPTE